MKIRNLISYLLILILCASTTAYAKGRQKQISGQLNLNTATVEQIDELPGMSSKKAQAIVDYRKEHPFKSTDDLGEVKGFSEKALKKLKPYLAVEGGNTLTVEEKKKEKKKEKKEKKEKKKKNKKSKD